MLYTGYDIQRGFLASAGWLAQKQADFLNNFTNAPFNYGNLTSVTASALDVFAHSVMPRGKPAFGINVVRN
jgi:poly(3-hydroxybutyrate) depolymerase